MVCIYIYTGACLRSSFHLGITPEGTLFTATKVGYLGVSLEPEPVIAGIL